MLTIATKMFVVGLTASMTLMGSTVPLASNAGIPANTYKLAENQIAINIQTPLDKWIEKLIWLESQGKDKAKVLDHNGRYSFGCLQFQKATFEAYGLKYGLIAPQDDIDNLIYDCRLQKQIAKKMIEEDYGNWQNWYTSVMVKGLGLPPRETNQLVKEENFGKNNLLLAASE